MAYNKNQYMCILCFTDCKVEWLGQETPKSTWELADSLPKSVISEYEKGFQADVSTETQIYGGHSTYIISSTESSLQEQPPPAKKTKTAKPTKSRLIRLLIL